MLFPQRDLQRIATGEVTLAFRRWDRAYARAGGQQRTAVGVVAIDAVDVIAESELTDEDARRAGFGSRAELLRELDRRRPGRLFRIAVRFAGADPRVALRGQDTLGPDELAILRTKLARMDLRSTRGPWTIGTLRLIAERPAVRAADLAASVGRERLAFKTDVRKLKELGLTESLEIGYRLSQRGTAFLAALDGADEPPDPGTGTRA